MLHIYDVSLRWVLRHRPVMLCLFVAVLGVTGYFYVIVPKGFIPDTDNDNYSVTSGSRAGHFVLPDGEISGAGCRTSWCRIRTSRASTPCTGGGNFGAGGANTAA